MSKQEKMLTNVFFAKKQFHNISLKTIGTPSTLSIFLTPSDLYFPFTEISEPKNFKHGVRMVEVINCIEKVVSLS